MRGMIRFVPIILLLLATGATAQDFNLYGFSNIDYNYLGSGARARAMGGAFTGVADDASALTWNPAGLVQVDKTQLSAAGSYLLLKQETDLSYVTGSVSPFNAEEDDYKLKLSYVSFVAPLRIKGHPFMTSVAFRAAQDRMEDWYSWASLDEFYTTATDTIDFTALRSNQTTVTGGYDIFSLGFGTGLYGDLAIGGALNIYSGSGEAVYFNEYSASVVSEFAGVSDTIDLVRAQSVTDEYDTEGYNFVGSLFYQRDIFRIGVKLETPFELTTEHDLTRRDTLYENNLPTFPIGDRAWKYLGKSKLDMPLTVTGGVSVTPKPNLVLAVDVEFKRFSESNYSVERDTLFTQRGSAYFPYHCIDEDTCSFSAFNSSGDKEEVFDEFDLKLRNSTDFRVGGEYLLQTKAGEVPLRAGLRLTYLQYTDVESVFRDGLDQVQPGFDLMDRVTRMSFSFGSGIHWRQIWLDFAVELITTEQKESGKNDRGSYELTRTNTSPTLTFNFTGFF